MPIPQLSSSKSPRDWSKRQINQRSSFIPHKKRPNAPKTFNYKYRRPGSCRSNFKISPQLIKRLIPVGLILFLIATIFLLGAFAWYSRDLPDPNHLLDRSVAQSTKIYDRTGEHVLYEVHGDQKRTLLELDQIPDYVKWATIAAEDKDFYHHKGFSLWAIFRTAITNVLKGQTAGGSTLTQQFVKNAILSKEKTYSRKIKELILSYQIEKKFSKDEILKMYLNEIPYGSTAYGVESAAQTFLHKSTTELTLAEAATLAAMPQSPTYYFNNQDVLLGRRNHILNLMAKEDYITKDEAKQAQDEIMEIKTPRENIDAPHFVMYIKELLTKRYGERTIENGGFKVYTTLDFDKQKMAEEIIQQEMEKRGEQYNASNAAMVSLNPKTGEILTMVGSKDFFNEEIDGQVNVTLRPRQPGSSLKPFVYTLAFDNGYQPESILFDLETNFGSSGDGGNYIPHNYDTESHGPVSLRQALAGSLNIPAVKLLYLVGPEDVLDLLKDFGYSTLKSAEHYGLSLVLGGGEVKLLEHTAAYGVLSQEGLKYDTQAILKIVDDKDEILFEFKPEEAKSKRVLNKKTAQIINNVLSDNQARAYVFGLNSSLQLGDRPVAAKTGTTNDYRDAWTIGYTPSLVTGVWVGNNDNSEMKRGASGSVMAGPIWHNFMQQALEKQPIEKFSDMPDLPEIDKPMLNGQIGNEQIVKIDKISGKLATDFTPVSMIEEKTYFDVHSILYYVDKNDPLGPAPDKPEKDSQFEKWEETIRHWAEENNYNQEQPPTEYDDVHIPGSQPEIQIISPQANNTFNETIQCQATANAKQGTISRVEYYVDNQFIGASKSQPYYMLNTNAFNLSSGQHILKAVAYDQFDNSASQEVNFNYTNNSYNINQPTVFWFNPQANQTLNSTDFPINISASVSFNRPIYQIKFYYQTGDQTNLIGTLTNPESLSHLYLTWPEAPSTGNYQLYLEVVDNRQNTYVSPKINITLK
ncbi:MAG: PBP1A family penicillin-binding protein [Patescibacteria group bacterium]|nr:PBP1A family penicillin-binding protein [Patescibacteria group bacterium]